MKKKEWISAWLPPVCYAIIIFYFSSRSHLPSFLPNFPFSDKLLHGGEYAIFGFLIYRAVTMSPRRPRNVRGRVALALILVITYGLSDELHQAFVPLRDPSLFDALADTIGGAVGIAIAYVLKKKEALP